MQITEQWIQSHAPSPAVAEEGRALSEAGSFAVRRRAEDGKTYWAACAGSARNPYYVSVDWTLSEDEPAYSCSCPSRHVPCKHVVGLLYEIMAGKPFETGELPSYVWKLRAKQAAEKARAEERLERARRHNAVAREKKIERQLEGLDKAEKLTNELLRGGIDAISTTLPVQSLERLAVELGNSDLPGARDMVERIALIERRVRQEGADARQGRGDMLRVLSRLRAMIARSRIYLREQLAAERYAMEEPMLYEMLGGEWNNDELRAVGLCRKNARLIQLSFDVSYDEARRAHIERGFWAELTRGEIVQTVNARSVKPLAGGAADDSCFSLLDVGELFETPILPCRRVWWDGEVAQEIAPEDLSALRERAISVAEAARAVAQQLREPLLPDFVPALVRVGRVGQVGELTVLEDAVGERLALRDRRADGAERASVFRLGELPEPPAEGDALFGLAFYDETDGRYCLQPYSLIRADTIVRLQF